MPSGLPHYATEHGTLSQAPRSSFYHLSSLADPTNQDKDKDKDNDRDDVFKYDGNDSDLLSDATAAQAMDDLLDDARNNAAAIAGPSSGFSDRDAPSVSPIFITPSAPDSLPEMVYNEEAIAEQQRDIA
ncbi:hypothetical protein C8J56DRAFT_1067028 [Mycena floridula]|nr:hypothetical protein C8J56DRAFT_1067028 [Mycena floridula]